MEEDYEAECDDIRQDAVKDSRKMLRISVNLLLKRQFGPQAVEWTEQKKIEELNRTTHIRLDRENLGYTDGLELLGGSVTNLYLQHNKIQVIENLEFLSGLTFLTLASNKIRKIEGLRTLRKLGFLDLSENLISHLETGELPKGLVILNLTENPCCSTEDYRMNLVRSLPKLKTLDGADIVRREKELAGHQFSDDEEDDEEVESEPEEDKYRNLGDMLISSQKRLESDYKTHKQRLGQLDEIRDNSEVPLTTRSSSRSSTT